MMIGLSQKTRQKFEISFLNIDSPLVGMSDDNSLF